MNMSEHDVVARMVAAIERAHQPLTWVKLERYVEISGDSVDSVQARRKAGKWLDGNQCKIVDGRLWINLPAVEEWVAKWEQSSPARQASNSGRASKANRSA
ncbi:hypothetical protein ACQ4WQ_08540 [Janthinobacterium sp. GB1R12]|uniref:hypothetical protein n=1 Tax=Janthinobacterium sp. GB1R12 TaxID=3424190 RepID=UPI003F254BA4